MKTTDKEHLEWIYYRLIDHYQEKPDADYMRKFKSILDEIDSNEKDLSDAIAIVGPVAEMIVPTTEVLYNLLKFFLKVQQAGMSGTRAAFLLRAYLKEQQNSNETGDFSMNNLQKIKDLKSQMGAINKTIEQLEKEIKDEKSADWIYDPKYFPITGEKYFPCQYQRLAKKSPWYYGKVMGYSTPRKSRWKICKDPHVWAETIRIKKEVYLQAVKLFNDQVQKEYKEATLDIPVELDSITINGHVLPLERYGFECFECSGHTFGDCEGCGCRAKIPVYHTVEYVEKCLGRKIDSMTNVWTVSKKSEAVMWGTLRWSREEIPNPRYVIVPLGLQNNPSFRCLENQDEYYDAISTER